MSNYFKLLARHGLKMWASNLLGFIAMTFVIYIVLFLVSIVGAIGFYSSISFSTIQEEGVDSIVPLLLSGGMIGLTIVLFVVYLVVCAFAQAFASAGSYGVAAEVVHHDRVTIASFFRHGFRKLFPMLGQTLVVYAMSIPFAVLYILGLVAMATGTAWGMALGAVLLLITILGAIVFAVMVMHAPVALMAGGKKVFASIGESFRVFKQRFGQVMLSVLFIFLIMLVGGGLIFLLYLGISGISLLDDYQAEPHPFRMFGGMVIALPLFYALSVIAVYTLVYRYQHAVAAPSSGEYGHDVQQGDLPGASVTNETEEVQTEQSQAGEVQIEGAPDNGTQQTESHVTDTTEDSQPAEDGQVPESPHSPSIDEGEAGANAMEPSQDNQLNQLDRDESRD